MTTFLALLFIVYFPVSVVFAIRAFTRVAADTPHMYRLHEMADEDIDSLDERLEEYARLVRMVVVDVRPGSRNTHPLCSVFVFSQSYGIYNRQGFSCLQR